MAVNQVSMNGEELINLTNDTVSELSLLSGAKAHDASGTQITGKAQYINPSLIINSNFKTNQRGISGTFTSIGAYFVDMWKLVEGSVTVNTDGTITLNGTICQVRESSINGDFLAYASAGTASYDDVTKTYTLTANGETISWAMLVYGKVKVPFVDTNEALELVKCQRNYISAPLEGRPCVSTQNDLWFFFELPTTMRILPSLDNAKVWMTDVLTNTAVGITDWTLSVGDNKNNGVLIRLHKENHGLAITDYVLAIIEGGLSAEP